MNHASFSLSTSFNFCVRHFRLIVYLSDGLKLITWLPGSFIHPPQGVNTLQLVYNTSRLPLLIIPIAAHIRGSVKCYFYSVTTQLWPPQSDRHPLAIKYKKTAWPDELRELACGFDSFNSFLKSRPLWRQCAWRAMGQSRLVFTGGVTVNSALEVFVMKNATRNMHANLRFTYILTYRSVRGFG